MKFIPKRLTLSLALQVMVAFCPGDTAKEAGDWVSTMSPLHPEKIKTNKLYQI